VQTEMSNLFSYLFVVIVIHYLLIYIITLFVESLKSKIVNYYISVWEHWSATALAVQKEFMFEISCSVFTFVAKHYGKRYLYQW